MPLDGRMFWGFPPPALGGSMCRVGWVEGPPFPTRPLLKRSLNSLRANGQCLVQGLNGVKKKSNQKNIFAALGGWAMVQGWQKSPPPGVDPFFCQTMAISFGPFSCGHFIECAGVHALVYMGIFYYERPPLGNHANNFT